MRRPYGKHVSGNTDACLTAAYICAMCNVRVFVCVCVFRIDDDSDDEHCMLCNICLYSSPESKAPSMPRIIAKPKNMNRWSVCKAYGQANVGRYCRRRLMVPLAIAVKRPNKLYFNSYKLLLEAFFFCFLIRSLSLLLCEIRFFFFCFYFRVFGVFLIQLNDTNWILDKMFVYITKYAIDIRHRHIYVIYNTWYLFVDAYFWVNEQSSGMHIRWRLCDTCVVCIRLPPICVSTALSSGYRIMFWYS